MLRRALVVTCTLTLLAAAAWAAEPAGTIAAPSAVFSDADLYQHVLGSIALIKSDFGEGTGWVFNKKNRLMVTNHHVVARNQRHSEDLWVIFPVRNGDQEVIAERSYYEKHGRKLEIKARLLFSSTERDLALIQLERLPDNVHELTLASAGARPGELVRSVGNPGKSEALWVHNSGTVRQLYIKEVQYRSGQKVRARMVETQQPIAGGDSGSPVVNGKGEVIGVVACGAEGPLFNYAIDLKELKAFLDEALKERDAADPNHPGGRRDKYGTPVDRPQRRGDKHGAD